jgi:hypothetical protein
MLDPRTFSTFAREFELTNSQAQSAIEELLQGTGNSREWGKAARQRLHPSAQVPHHSRHFPKRQFQCREQLPSMQVPHPLVVFRIHLLEAMRQGEFIEHGSHPGQRVSQCPIRIENDELVLHFRCALMPAIRFRSKKK